MECKNHNIIFYAPLGHHIPCHMIGGAEAGCRKTLKIYRDAGVKVDCVEKAVNTGTRTGYAVRTMGTALKLWWKCLTHRHALVHFVGFYDRVIHIERVLIKGCRLCGARVVYEMRNGNMHVCYRDRDEGYRRCQRSIWGMCAGTISQGEPYVDLIKAETGRESFLYPNFLPDRFLTPPGPKADVRNPKFIFFGRLVENKNIDLIIETLAELKKSRSGATLDLIGGIDDGYRATLNQLIDRLGVADSVKFHGHQSLDYIAKRLRQSHFFIFPSGNPTEGHSNSLTEAMGCGVVPVASPQGFNESVIADDDLIVREMTPKAYAAAVDRIILEGVYEAKSREVYERVARNFTETVVGHQLLAYMDGISR